MKNAFLLETESLRKDIIRYLETEGFLMPASYGEIAQVEKMNEEELVKKAQEFNIEYNKYIRKED